MFDVNESLRAAILRFTDRAIDEKLKNDVRTTIPGYFLKFDPATQLAEVQIGVKGVDLYDKTFTPSPIIACPLCVYGASGGLVEVEIQPGDEVLIHFSMRCIDGWREQGGVAPLPSVRRFRKSDAFVVLAPRSASNVIENYSNDGIKIRSLDGTRYVHVKNDGTIEIKNDSGIASLLPNGDFNANDSLLTADGKVITAAGVDLDEFKALYDLHVHNHGTPTTSVPVV